MKDFELYELYDETDEFHSICVASVRSCEELKNAAAAYRKEHPDCVLVGYKVERS